jgi:hypothetical protein
VNRLAVVGPLPLAEHILWLVVLSLAVFLVYHGLRVASPAEAARRGVARWLAFMGGTIVLMLVFSGLSAIL